MNKSKRNVHKQKSKDQKTGKHDQATRTATAHTHEHVKLTTETSKTNHNHQPSRVQVK